MSIAQVMRVINQMQDDGVVERYAIGGAVGATFYLEPVATLDALRDRARTIRAAALRRGVSSPAQPEAAGARQSPADYQA